MRACLAVDDVVSGDELPAQSLVPRWQVTESFYVPPPVVSSMRGMLTVQDLAAAAEDPFAEAEEEDPHGGRGRGGGGGKKELWNPRPCKSRRVEQELCGETEPGDFCFGCEYGVEQAPEQHYLPLQKLSEIMHSMLGRCRLVELARKLEDYYVDHIQLPYNRQMRRRGSPKTLPLWRAAMILEHFREHVTDPELQLYLMQVEVMERRVKLADTAEEVSVSNPDLSRVSEDGAKALERLVKLQLSIMKTDPKKCNNYAADRYVHAAAQRQGPIAQQTKSLWTHLRERHQRK